MNLLRLGGVLAGAMLLAPMAATTANAAEIHPASVSTPAFAGDDCYYSHWWDGRYHRHVRLVCDDGDDYYGGDYYNGGGFRGHRGFDHGNRGGGDFNRGGGNFNRGGVVGGSRGTRTGGTTGGAGGGNFRGGGGGRH